MPQLRDEAAKRAQLARMKRIATALLVVAVVVYLVARALVGRFPWLDPVRAMAEAAMVGGLADWFAVTALFRHPLGLPIPHTAIVPTRKDQVGRSLGNFVQRNFLTREVIAARLRNVHAGESLARWIADPDNARLIARHAARALASGAQVLRDEDVQRFIDGAVERRLHALRVAPLLGRLLALVTTDDRHQEILNEAVRLIARGVAEHRWLIREKIAAESPWWIPEAVDDRIHEKVVGAIQRTLDEVRDDPEHPLRARFDEALRDFIVRLDEDPRVIERAERIKEDLIASDAMRRFSASLWTDAKAALVRYAENPEHYPPGTIERALTSLGDALLADPALIQRVDDAIVDVALYLVTRYQDEVGRIIEQTVQSWDPELTSQRIEVAIGKDLQYIRINGTVVGGLAGLGIWLVSRFF